MNLENCWSFLSILLCHHNNKISFFKFWERENDQMIWSFQIFNYYPRSQVLGVRFKNEMKLKFILKIFFNFPLYLIFSYQRLGTKKTHTTFFSKYQNIFIKKSIFLYLYIFGKRKSVKEREKFCWNILYISSFFLSPYMYYNIFNWFLLIIFSKLHYLEHQEEKWGEK